MSSLVTQENNPFGPVDTDNGDPPTEELPEGSTPPEETRKSLAESTAN